MELADEYGVDSEFMREMRALYLEGTAERIAELRRLLAGLRRQPDDGPAMTEGYRSAHSLAGAAASYGFEFASQVGRRMEELLGAARDERRAPSGRELDVLDELVAILEGYFQEATPGRVPADRPLPSL